MPSEEGKSSGTLGEVLRGAGFSGWTVCEQCAFEYPQRADGEPPCPRCYPPNPVPRGPAAARPDLTAGEVLDAMAMGGVNMHAYHHATLANFDGRKDPHVMGVVEDWLAAWRKATGWKYASRPWLYLYGDRSELARGQVQLGAAGNGKTHIAVAVARKLFEDGQLAPERFRFVTAESLLLEMEATFRSDSPESESRLLATFGKYDLLVIDDLGVREPTAHAIRILDELTKRREGQATIWTSNLSLKVVAQQSEAFKRITSRIAGECGEGARFNVKFSGPDRRLAKSKGE